MTESIYAHIPSALATQKKIGILCDVTRKTDSDSAEVPVKRLQPLQVPSDLVQEFKAVCKGRAIGRSMNDTTARLVKWFIRQPDYVKTAVLSDVDRGMESSYADALVNLADELFAGSSRRSDDPPRDAPLRAPEEPPPPKRPRRK